MECRPFRAAQLILLSRTEEYRPDRAACKGCAPPRRGAPPTAAYGLDRPPDRRFLKSVGSEGMSDFRLSKGMAAQAAAIETQTRQKIRIQVNGRRTYHDRTPFTGMQYPDSVRILEYIATKTGWDVPS
ncbi:hypothetical protein DF3PB_310023 [uncultured Defluviicoccus sp.]|uniref:Uncharacterized protein n=1 Tax=metagenome TaxID=256318 RepID=A0A380TDX6_9ZZZZ|nr:hypothetical protein DF3PB_310023 [uncultured Defluviicoccus sp.]